MFSRWFNVGGNSRNTRRRPPQPRTGIAGRLRPQVEGLEERLVPDGSVFISERVLYVLCDPNPSRLLVDHTVDPMGMPVTLVNDRVFPDRAFDRIEIRAGAADDEIAIWATERPVTVDGGGGADRFTVGSPQTGMARVLDYVLVLPADERSTLIVDDWACRPARTFTLQVLGGIGVISGTDIGTVCYYPCQNVSLITGQGNDTVNVLATLDCTSVTIYNCGGEDTVNVGNAWNGVQDVRGSVHIGSSPFPTILNIDNCADPLNHVVTISHGGSPVATVAGLAPATISWDMASVSSVTLWDGTGYGDYTIQNPLAPVFFDCGGGYGVTYVP